MTLPTDNMHLTEQEVLAHADFLQKLARSLVGDSHKADDLVQQTWLTVLDKPPHGVKALGSWLAGVVRNYALRSHRDDVHRRARERSAAKPEETPSAAEQVAARQRVQVLNSALEELPKPFQEVISLRYYMGLPPREIAKVQGAPLSTVKSRLHRALAKLREILDAEHGGDRKAWLTALAPIAFPKTGAGVGISITMGMMLMKKTALIVGGFLLLTGLVIMGISGVDQDFIPEYGSDPILGVPSIKSANSENSDSGIVAAMKGGDPEKIGLHRTPIKMQDPVLGPDHLMIEVQAFVHRKGLDVPVPGAMIEYSHVFQLGDRVRSNQDYKCNAIGSAKIPIRIKPTASRLIYGRSLRVTSTDNHLLSSVVELKYNTRASNSQKPFTASFPDGRIEFEKQLKVRLYPQRKIKILVKDQQGKAVPEVPVGLIRCKQGLDSLRGLIGSKCLQEGLTDKLGVCTLAYPANQHYDKLQQWTYAGFLFPLKSRNRWYKPLSKEHFQGKEITLVMPPTGKLKIKLPGQVGDQQQKTIVTFVQNADLPGRFSMDKLYGLSIRNYYLSPRVHFKSFESSFTCCRFRKTGITHLVYEHIGLGIDLDIFGIWKDRWKISRIRCTGPSRPGDTTMVEIHLPIKDKLARGTLLGSDNQPFAGKPIIAFSGRSSDTIRSRMRGDLIYKGNTDGEGRFAIPLTSSCGYGGLNKLILVPRSHFLQPNPPFWLIDLPEVPDGEEILFKKPFPLETFVELASGTVCHPDGKPASECMVSLYQYFGYGAQRPWQRIARIRGARDGTWSFSGRAQKIKIMVQGELKGRGITKKVFGHAGDREITLTLVSYGGIEAKVLVDKPEYLQNNLIRFALKPETEWHGKFIFFGDNHPDGRIVWPKLPPGSYEFQVLLPGLVAKPYLRISGIFVEQNEILRPQAIASVDLRGKFEIVKLLPRNQYGKIPNFLEFHLFFPNGYIRQGRIWDKKHQCAFLLKPRGQTPKIKASCFGYKTQLITLDKNPNTVRFYSNEFFRKWGYK